MLQKAKKKFEKCDILVMLKQKQNAKLTIINSQHKHKNSIFRQKGAY